jgi:excisionase family DNA binding protein
VGRVYRHGPKEGEALMTLEETLTAAIERAVSEAVRRELRVLAEAQPSKDGAGYLSVGDAARYAHVHPATVREWVKEGRIPRHQAGRRLRIRRDELDRCLSKDPGVDARTPDEIADEILNRKGR